MQCYQEPNCVSYNFKKNGENKCDLNNATYEHDNEHAGDLAEDENYVYREAEVGVKFKIESNKFIWKCKTLNKFLELFLGSSSKPCPRYFEDCKLPFCHGGGVRDRYLSLLEN